MKKISFYLINIAFFILLSCAGSEQLMIDEDFDSLQNEKSSQVDKIKFNKKKFDDSFKIINDNKSGHWSIMFYNLDNDSVVVEYNSRKNLVPASNLKLLTTAAALKVLGPYYRFKTEYFYSGEIKNRTLNGNILVKGHGDPTVGDNYFSLKKDQKLINLSYFIRDNLKINKIRGDIKILNPVDFNFKYGRAWDIDDIGTYYNPVISPVSFNENLIKINVSRRGKIKVTPDYPLVFRKDTMKVERTQFHRVIGTDSIVIKSGFKNNLRGFITINRPEKLFLNEFAKNIKQSGIKINGKKYSDDEIFKIKTVYSDSLENIVHKINRESNNFYSEQVFRAIAREIIDTYDSSDSLFIENEKYMNHESYNNYLKIISEVYKKIFSINDFTICDGSGLSRRNYINSESIVKVLDIMYDDKKLFLKFLSSFPSPGFEGSLRKKFLNETLPNRVFAKTGSMSGINNLSGYIVTKKGTRIAFSILNNYYSYYRGTMNNRLEEMLKFIIENY